MSSQKDVQLIDFSRQSLLNQPSHGILLPDGNILISTSEAIRVSDRLYLDATRLSILNKSGLIIKSRVIDSIGTTDNNFNTYLIEDKIHLLGNAFMFPTGRVILEYVLDLQLNLIKKTTLEPVPGRIALFKGAFLRNQQKILYGSYKSPDKLGLAFLAKYNGDSLVSTYLFPKNPLLSNSFVQHVDWGDNSSVYSIRYDNYPAGNSSPSNEYILASFNEHLVPLKEDTIRTSTRNFTGIKYSNNHLYLFTREHLPQRSWSGYGHISKFNLDQGKFDFSLELPQDQLIDGRTYYLRRIIHDPITDQIIAMGTVFDNSDSKVPGADVHSTYNGFIAAVTTDGQLDNLRLYKFILPDPDTLTIGRFRPAAVVDLVRNSDTTWLALGNVGYNMKQITHYNNSKDEETFILRLDNDFNVTGHTKEIQRLVTEPAKVPIRNFEIGDRWTYEVTDNPFQPINVTFITMEIVDTVTMAGKKAFKIETSNFGTEYMVQEGSKVYFWNYTLEEFALNLDFEEQDGYYSTYQNLNDERDSTFIEILDTGRQVIDGTTLLYQDVYLSDEIGLRDPGEIRVYENIGFDYRGITTGANLSYTGEFFVEDIRCFNSNDLNINFKGYPCDTTWRTTSSRAYFLEKLEVHPNPIVNGIAQLKIHDPIAQLQLLDPLGRILYNYEGQDIPDFLHLPAKGVFFLRVTYERNNFEDVVKLISN